ncbi:MAG TPA: alpha/beta hydrolase [Acidimicrobiales bacterium]|nr:alpha/beta hydrolase [Acidimicrobiales bacterium]
MTRAALDGVELYYEVAGTGPPLLLISGTGGDLRVPPSVFDGPLATSFTIAAYDQRGLGRSSVPPGPYAMADYADDAAGLLDVLGWPDALVMGISFGGMVAQELALRHGTRVRRLVLACTSSGGAGGASYPLHELVDVPEEDRIVRHIELADTRYDAAWRAENTAAFDSLATVFRVRAAVGKDEPGRAEGAALQLEARRRHDTWDRLPGISCPTFVCGGLYDGIAPRANSEKLASTIPDATLRLFEGGHLFLIQDRTSWPAIVEFLSA